MLDSKTVRKIEDFVFQKPRSLFEIAQYLDVSWRTADRYVDQIVTDFGTIATRTFREGTRGALKVVYSADAHTFKSSAFQESLEKSLMAFKKKEDFSAFDIFQHVPELKKKARVSKAGSECDLDEHQLLTDLESAQKQVLIFSGNLSFINLKSKGRDFLEVIDKLVKRNVSIKVVCRVDLASLANIEKMLSLNYRNAKELIEVRHAEQPLRAVLVDNKVASLKEIKEPTGKINELNKKLFIFYTIKDKEWIEWLARVFWKMFSGSVDANKRLSELALLKISK